MQDNRGARLWRPIKYPQYRAGLPPPPFLRIETLIVIARTGRFVGRCRLPPPWDDLRKRRQASPKRLHASQGHEERTLKNDVVTLLRNTRLRVHVNTQEITTLVGLTTLVGRVELRPELRFEYFRAARLRALGALTNSAMSRRDMGPSLASNRLEGNRSNGSQFRKSNAKLRPESKSRSSSSEK